MPPPSVNFWLSECLPLDNKISSKNSKFTAISDILKKFMGKFEILNTHNLLRPKFAPVSVGKLLLAAPLTFLTHNIAAQFLDVSM